MKIRKSFQTKKPTLYLISTPIGNLKDLTIRALETLKKVDIIYAEDTRVTTKLLELYEIKKPLYSYHSFNEEQAIKEIFKHLENGLSIGYCTDAGTPGISDPGYYLVAEIKDYFPIVSIPGASSILAALVSSSLVPQPFTFVGFVGRKQTQRKKMLSVYKDYPHTLIFFESANRLSGLLDSLFEVYGKRKCVVARELTKLFETFYEFYLGDDYSKIELKGEFVVLVEGYQKDQISRDDILKLVDELLTQGMSKKDAIKKVSEKLEVAKNLVYQEVIKREKES